MGGKCRDESLVWERGLDRLQGECEGGMESGGGGCG